MNITYEQIQNANKQVKTTDIKGNSYTEVNQRIKAFRMLFPTGCIKTELVKLEDGICVMRAIVSYKNENNEDVVLGEGTAYEKENSTFINKTSYIENCETSAVGRALGMAGFGIDTSVASYEEVATAIANQGKDISKELIGKTKAKALETKCKNDNIPVDMLLKAYKVDSLDKLTEAQFMNANANWEKIKAKASE